MLLTVRELPPVYRDVKRGANTIFDVSTNKVLGGLSDAACT